MTRLVDIVLSVLFLILVSPLWLIVIPALRFTGEGEVFYRQPRVGKDGKLFNLLKFATMLKDSPNLGTGMLTVHNDPRVLPLGRLLRKTKINELPQLINVLKGDMSIIGPRPQAQPHFDVFPAHVREKLITVRPGLSGIGSIVFRDEERILARSKIDQARCYSGIIAPYKGQVELWYIKRQNFKSYMLLILLTLWIIPFPNSQIYFRLFPDLPRPPVELEL